MPLHPSIEAAFSGPKNDPGNSPTARQLLVPPEGAGFEARAFAALVRNARKLGIRAVYKCSAARMDGYIVTQDGEVVLIEMKESLRWGSTQSATFQFLAGRELLELKSRRGIVLFERWSDEWEKTGTYGAWGQFALHASEVSRYIQLGALRLQGTKFVPPPSDA